MNHIRIFFLGSKKPNNEQLKSLSKLFYNLGTLLLGSVVLKFFLSPDVERASTPFVIISTLLAILFYLWATRMLKGVK